MTSGNQIVHNFTAIYWGEKVNGSQKKGNHTSNKFTDKTKFKPMIKSIAEVGKI